MGVTQRHWLPWRWLGERERMGRQVVADLGGRLGDVVDQQEALLVDGDDILGGDRSVGRAAAPLKRVVVEELDTLQLCHLGLGSVSHSRGQSGRTNALIHFGDLAVSILLLLIELILVEEDLIHERSNQSTYNGRRAVHDRF